MIRKLLLASLIFFGGANYEEETESQQIEEQVSESASEEDVVKEQIDKLLENTEVKKAISEAVEEKLKSVISAYTDENTTNNIVGWIINVLSMVVIVFLFIANIKRKGGITADDVKEILSKEITNEDVKKDLAKVNNDIEQRLDVIVKALVLAQDKTASSKLALLELLNTPESKTIAENIEKLEEVKEEAVKVVKEDYKNIF